MTGSGDKGYQVESGDRGVMTGGGPPEASGYIQSPTTVQGDRLLDINLRHLPGLVRPDPAGLADGPSDG